MDDKWIGIAVEAMGEYWHSDALPGQQEADRKKRLICKEKNVILVEIWENIEQGQWLNELIRQIEEQAGTRLSKEQFSKLRNYLGNLKNI